MMCTCICVYVVSGPFVSGWGEGREREGGRWEGKRDARDQDEVWVREP